MMAAQEIVMKTIVTRLLIPSLVLFPLVLAVGCGGDDSTTGTTGGSSGTGGVRADGSAGSTGTGGSGTGGSSGTGGTTGTGGTAGTGGSAGTGGAAGAGGAAGTSDAGGNSGDASLEGGDASLDRGDAADAACNTLTNSGPVVVVTTASGQPPPLSGGSIVPGTYYLTALVGYTGVDSGSSLSPGRLTQETVQISAGALDYVLKQGTVDGGFGADSRGTFTYTVSSGNLMVNSVCGTTGDIVEPFEVVTGDGGPVMLRVLVGGNALGTLTLQ
jgi:hypothetical protein